MPRYEFYNGQLWVIISGSVTSVVLRAFLPDLNVRFIWDLYKNLMLIYTTGVNNLNLFQ